MNAWPKVKLGEVLRRVERFEFRDELTEYPFAGTYSFARGIFVGERKLGSTFALPKVQRVRRGDFVYCKIMAWEGAFGLVPAEADNCVMSGAFVAYELNRDRIDERFLDYFFKVPAHWQSIGSQSSGTNVRRQSLHPNQFETAEIPLPPLAEQRRVVARIEALAAQIHEARTLRQQAAEETEALFSNSREKTFSRLESNSDFPSSNLGDVARFRTGYAFRSSDYRPSGRLIFRVSNFRADGSIDMTDCVFLADELASDYADYQLLTDDILMVMVGGSVGKLCKIPESVLPALMNQNMWRINPIQFEVLSADYLFHFLQRCNRTVGAGLTQSTHGHLTQSEYKLRKIPIPALPEQRRIVAELDALQAEVDAMKRHQVETAAELDAMLPAVLDRAFTGAL